MRSNSSWPLKKNSASTCRTRKLKSSRPSATSFATSKTTRNNSAGSQYPFQEPAGIPGCLLYQSAEVTITLTAPNGTGLVPWPVPIPNVPALLGGEVFFQALTLDLPGFVRWASLSNAVGIRIGDR